MKESVEIWLTDLRKERTINDVVNQLVGRVPRNINSGGLEIIMEETQDIEFEVVESKLNDNDK